MRLVLPLLFAPLLWCAEMKPWAPSVAALTDHRPAVHQPAIEALIRHGQPAFDDVATLATDADWRVRGRVVTVVAGIGGERATALVLAASRDRDARVRGLAAQGLGRLPGPGVHDRLVALLGDAEAEVRTAAARGLAVLGDAASFVPLASLDQETEAAVRRDRLAALRELAQRPLLIPALIDAIGGARGSVQLRLVAAAGEVGDPRLAPVLAGLLRSPDADIAEMAARALAADGDSRALQALCAAAADERRAAVAKAAAETLRLLTGHPAGPGGAWTVWWRDNAEAAAARAARDAFIADCFDPQRAIGRAELAAWTPEQLMPLVDGALGQGAWWWPRRAAALLLADDATRWTAPLLARIRAAEDPEIRLALILLLDQLGDPGATPALRELAADGEARRARARARGDKPRNDPERLALAAALERRGGRTESRPIERAPFK